ncbi:hypothetical protein [Sedimenticola thiotaurini]|uniref:hypothetical protein n=1 Tax=Sedimenticola thiotaurini TaxID=1543721 RepID=UPI000699C478|nr:hypothetical protein [Sedimenticola thiotaurini]
MTARDIALLCCLLPVVQGHATSVPAPFQVCADYHCDVQKPVKLGGRHWQEIRALFTDTRTAEQEREQIRAAIALMEQQVGEQTGSWRDLAKNDGDGSEIGQLDCIAESTNTTIYLKLLAQDRLLRWHQVTERRRRNPWLFNIHWTATIMEIQSRQEYAVDSWFFANGHPPVIQPIEAWLAGQDFGPK